MADRFGVLLLSDTCDTVDPIINSLHNKFSSIHTAHIHDAVSFANNAEHDAPDLLILTRPVSWIDELALPGIVRQYWPDCQVVMVSDPGCGSIPEETLSSVDGCFMLSTEGLNKLCGFVSRVIAPREQVEEALRDSEERFRTIFNNAAVGIVLAHLDGKLVLANRVMQTLLGYTEEELKRMSFREFTHPDDLIITNKLFERVRCGELDHYDVERRYLRKDGKLVYARALVSTIPNSDGTPAYFLVMVVDTSERKRAEAARRESEERFRATFQDAAIGMVLVGTHGFIMEANPVFHKMLGYDNGDLHGMSICDITHSDDLLNEAAIIEELLAGRRTSCQIEKRYIHKCGEPIWARVGLSLVRDSDGEPLFAIGMVEDITASKQAEIEISRRNRRLILLNSVAAALTASLDRAEIFAGLRSIFIGNNDLPPGRIFVYDGLHDCLRLELQWRMRKSRPAPIPLTGSRYEHVVRKKMAVIPHARGESDGGSIVDEDGLESSDIILIPMVADGEIQGVLELVNETALIAAEVKTAFYKTLARQIGLALKKARLHEQASTGHHQLQILSRKLVRVQEDERRHLARELHDEIGSVLTALSITIEMASGRASDKSFAHIQQAKAMVKNLTDQVHELSLNLRPALLDDVGLVPALFCHFRKYTEQTGIEVEFEQMTEIKELPADISICAFRIVQEALTNVARHAGTQAVDIRLSVNEKKLVVDISDRGNGFNVETAFSSGSGMGLAGMRERARAAGGDFHLTSGPGIGTTIRATLPVEGIE